MCRGISVLICTHISMHIFFRVLCFKIKFSKLVNKFGNLNTNGQTGLQCDGVWRTVCVSIIADLRIILVVYRNDQGKNLVQ